MGLWPQESLIGPFSDFDQASLLQAVCSSVEHYTTGMLALRQRASVGCIRESVVCLDRGQGSYFGHGKAPRFEKGEWRWPNARSVETSTIRLFR